jgi:hypothetical protein
MINFTSLLDTFSGQMIQKTIPLFNKIKEEVSYYYNDGFLDYYSNSLDKYKNIKTLLYRQPTPFYDIYYPINLEFDKTDISTNSLSNLFIDNNCVTIIGAAGSGKSMLLRHLFLNSFVDFFKSPIYIALRDLSIDESNLEIYIRKNILDVKLSPNDNFLEKLLSDGDFIFFLDGYDEIKSTEKQKITKKLEEFIDKYPNNKYILTSRPYSNIEYFKNFKNLHIKKLNLEDINNFINLQVKDTIFAEKIIGSIKNNKQKYINSFLENSLLLTLYIITYSKNSTIPENKFLFYRRVFDVLFTEHDNATKIGYEREIKTKLNQETIDNILQIFSFLSFFDNYFDFDKKYIVETFNKIKKKNLELTFDNNYLIEDLKLTIGLWIEDGGIYQFAHRSMQEYFAAVFISNIKSINNKLNIYTKLIEINKYYDFDIKNFLYLSYEMDKKFFIENYSLPLLKIIKSYFLKEDGSLNYEFPYMNEGFKGEIIEKRIHNRIIYEIGSFGHSFSEPIIDNCFITSDITLNIDYSSIILKLLTNKNIVFNQIFLKREDVSAPYNEMYTFNKDEILSKKSINYFKSIKLDKELEKIINKINKIENSLVISLNNEARLEDDYISMIEL